METVNNIISDSANAASKALNLDDSNKTGQESPSSSSSSSSDSSTSVPISKPQKTHVERELEKEKRPEELNPPPKRKPKNPFKNLTPRAHNLIYWEDPAHSAAVMVAGLSFLIYTSCYSLFNTFCALATILIGMNWVYVIGRKQLNSLLNQDPVNPHEHLLTHKPWYLEREKVEKYLDVTLDSINFTMLEIQKIVYVEDSLRTIKYVFIFYALWTLGSFISFRTFFAIGFILAFSAPIGYQKNKKVVDEKLEQTNKLLHTHMDRGLNVAKQHTGGIYQKARSYAADKGLVNINKEE